MIPLGPTSSSDTQRVLGDHIENILSSILPHVTLNPQLAPLNTNASFKRAVQMAIDRAVREVRSIPLFVLDCMFSCVLSLDHPPRRRAVRHYRWHFHLGAGRKGFRHGVQRGQAPQGLSSYGSEASW